MLLLRELALAPGRECSATGVPECPETLTICLPALYTA